MLGMEGELSSGEMGVSSNSVTGVSGSIGLLGSTRLTSEGKDDMLDILLLLFCLVSVDSAAADARLCISKLWLNVV